MFMTNGKIEVNDKIMGVLKKYGLFTMDVETANDVLNLFQSGGGVYCFYVNHEGFTCDDIDVVFKEIYAEVGDGILDAMFFDYGLGYEFKDKTKELKMD